METRKRPKLRLWARLLLCLVIFIGIFLPLAEIYYNSLKYKYEKKQTIFTYSTYKNVDYKVFLFDNTFTDKTEMSANKVYISDLVNNIKMKYNYTYSGTEKTNLNYSYSIDGKLYGQNQNSNLKSEDIVWEKDYKILNNKKLESNSSSGFNINEEIDIDYQKYKQEVLKFRKQFGMNLDVKLKLVMKINIDGEYNKKPIKENDQIVMYIPVGVQAFSITEDYKKSDTKSIYKNEYIEYNKPYIIICLVISILSIIMFFITYKAIFNIKPKNHYTRELTKLLKSYDDIIVEVETPIKERGMNIIKVKNFEEMVDLEEELRIPIIFYEDLYKCYASFTITHENTIYKYIITE